MERVLEPEYMDTADEAEAYDAMDHSGPNAAFVERLLSLGARGRMLDIGTGPAHIPILVAERDPEAEILALDAAEHMLRVARANLARQPEGVFHLTDDVLLLARIVTGTLAVPPPLSSS
jgi:tRNA1(Val) A37 N6-methylase TrmN6